MMYLTTDSEQYYGLYSYDGGYLTLIMNDGVQFIDVLDVPMKKQPCMY